MKLQNNLGLGKIYKAGLCRICKNTREILSLIQTHSNEGNRDQYKD